MSDSQFVIQPPIDGEINPKKKPNDEINANTAPARSAVIPSSFIGMLYIAGIHSPFPSPKIAKPTAESHIDTGAPSTAIATPISFNNCPNTKLGL